MVRMWYFLPWQRVLRGTYADVVPPLSQAQRQLLPRRLCVPSKFRLSAVYSVDSSKSEGLLPLERGRARALPPSPPVSLYIPPPVPQSLS